MRLQRSPRRSDCARSNIAASDEQSAKIGLQRSLGELEGRDVLPERVGPERINRTRSFLLHEQPLDLLRLRDTALRPGERRPTGIRLIAPLW